LSGSRSISVPDTHRNRTQRILSGKALLIGDPMKTSRLRALRVISLLFLIPGIAGLLFSAYLSTYYVEMMPRSPDPIEERMTPRVIHGITIFQTEEEDMRLSRYEFSSVGIFLVGLVLGVVYLEKWAGSQSTEEEGGYNVVNL
jgi:hypothetical protein